MAFDAKKYRGTIGAGWVWAAAALVLGALAVFVLRSVAMGDGSRLLPVYSVETDEKKVAVTFNCAWDAADIPAILETLEKYDAQATFFVLGQWAEDNPEEVKMIAEAGHEIGTHSNTHPDMAALSTEKIAEELLRSCEKIEPLCAQKVTLFRAPSGSYDNELIKTAADLGFMTIQWDVDSRDWKGLSAAEMTENVTAAVQNGSIILFHSGAKHTPEALPYILEALAQRGFRFVKVSDLVYSENYTIDHTGRQHSAEKTK